MPASHITRAIQQFTQDLTLLPVDRDLDSVLQQAVQAEREIRTLFASDPTNDQLQDRYLGLINVFAVHPAVRRSRARRIRVNTTDIYDHYVFPVDAVHRKPDLMPSTVPSVDAFKQYWDVFTHGALSKMRSQDWENVVAAGGSVLACLMAPHPKIEDLVKLNEYYQSDVYASCDIDLFIWGLTAEQVPFILISHYVVIINKVWSLGRNENAQHISGCVRSCSLACHMR